MSNLMSNLISNTFKLLLILISITIIFSCNPDLADSPTSPRQLTDKEIIDTLKNQMIFSIDGKSWVSDNSSRAFYKDGGIEINASKWIQNNSVVETIKLFIYLDNEELRQTNYNISQYDTINNINNKINFSQYKIYTYKVPVFDINFYTNIGNIQIIESDNNYIAGKFNLDMFEFPTEKSNNISIKNGYFRVNITK